MGEQIDIAVIDLIEEMMIATKGRKGAQRISATASIGIGDLRG
jgi:hypothetical protein